VSIFISSLAFDDPAFLLQAKTAVLAASVLAGVVGYFALREEGKLEPVAKPAVVEDQRP
jgi:NhaA family Na+:H+ antiporter